MIRPATRREEPHVERFCRVRVVLRLVTRVARGPSDLDLIRAYLGGDVHAFDTLFRRYHKAIYGLTFRLLRDRQLAEDLSQETFFQILRTIHRINDSFNFSAWIHRIATNLCYDELRRRKEEYLFMEGKALTEDGRCATISYLLDNFPPGTLRREQRKMVAQHLDACATCTQRYPNPPQLQRAGVVVPLDGAVVTRRITSGVRHPRISFMDGRTQSGYRRH